MSRDDDLQGARRRHGLRHRRAGGLRREDHDRGGSFGRNPSESDAELQVCQEMMISKVRAGGTGYDIVVPGDYAVKIMIEEGLLAETHPNQMPNFKYVK